MHRTAPTRKNYLTANRNSEKAESLNLGPQHGRNAISFSHIKGEKKDKRGKKCEKEEEIEGVKERKVGRERRRGS